MKKTELTNYELLKLYQFKYPELTFDNKGYKYLSKDIQERHKEQIKEISDILTETIERFRQFNNFKPRKDGSFDIRVQYAWDSNYNGVGYFNIELFKDGE